MIDYNHAHEPGVFPPDPAQREANLLQQARQRSRKKISALQFQIYDLCVQKNWRMTKVAASLGVSAGRVFLVKRRVSNLIRKELKALQTQTP
jgi:hypothetical protein